MDIKQAELDRLHELYNHTSRFFNKHGMPSLIEQSCLVCGRIPESIAIRHLELPNIVVCGDCIK